MYVAEKNEFFLINTNVHFGIIIICGKNYRMDDVCG